MEARAIKRCRLCLAPESECVSIFTTFAADKEPLPQKIQSCVRIRIHDKDRLSPKICHACISYLNSWQSFKNRCDAAQRKQRSWMGLPPSTTPAADVKPSVSITPAGTSSIPANRQQLQKQIAQNQQAYRSAEQRDRERQRELALKATRSVQRTIADSIRSQLSSEVDISFIKQEPNDRTAPASVVDEDEESHTMELDPTQFLAQNDDEDDDDASRSHQTSMEEGPPILTSLGLTHINAVNPYNLAASDNEGTDETTVRTGSSSTPLSGRTPALCSVCDMSFSNRANARRHERNIHGVNNNPLNAQQVVDTSTNLGASGSGLIRPITLGSAPKVAPPIFRQRVFGRKTQPEVYDYSNPAKYRHLLTPMRLAFILKNMEFLEQIQTMMCKCCNKQFPSYKFFMGHMRKKYRTLPRQVCFRCLKQFETKGQFIGHLKRKDCVNLYQIVMADETISKDNLTDVKQRLGPKDTLQNRTYGCRQCTKTFRLKREFHDHVYRDHVDMQRSRENANAPCATCKATFTDTMVRRKHYYNLECMSFIICGSCDERFNTQTEFIDHAYSVHLNPETLAAADAAQNTELFEIDPVQSVSRSPAFCSVCGKQYNNYYNVLRHMEVKHPNEVPKLYFCAGCSQGFARQCELREHLQTVHGAVVGSRLLAKPPAVINFICKTCNLPFEHKDEWLDHQAKHSKFCCMYCDYDTEMREDILTHLREKHDGGLPTEGQLVCFSCKICRATYKSGDLLREHIRQEHGIEKPDLNNSYEELAGISLSAKNGVSSIKAQPYDDEGDDQLDADEEQDDDEDGGLNDMIDENGVVVKQELMDQDEAAVNVNAGAFGQRRVMPYTSQKFKCRYCNKRYTNKILLRRHLMTDHGMGHNLVSCTLCAAEFINDKGLKVHLWRAHKIRESEYASVLPPDILVQVNTAPIRNNANAAIKQEKDAPPTTSTVAVKEFECNVCHIVYRSKEQLRHHNTSVHGLETSAADDEDELDESLAPMGAVNTTDPDVVAWYQCRYCKHSFNTSKKLTIHMNTHEEVDKTDHTCKDCGIVYATKKSLWVHRQKKHPRYADHSPCEMCNKTFFDKTELYFHMIQAHAQEADFFEASQQGTAATATEFAAHPLLHMLDAGDSSFQPRRPVVAATAASTINNNNNNNNGQARTAGEKQEFACDMCPKSFSILNALQVHRGWHFRSPDGRKVRDPQDTWQPDQMPPSKQRRIQGGSSTASGNGVAVATSSTAAPSGSGNSVTRNCASPSGATPTCQYCNATFASGNNLRRHIVEVHRRNESRLQREQANQSPTVFIEKERECQTCDMQFGTANEWIDHKIMHARTQKPSTTFEWNCEICGKMFTRKERLLQHMISHLSSKEFDGEGGGESMDGVGENSSQYDQSQSSAASSNHENGVKSTHQQYQNDADDDSDDDDDDSDEDSDVDENEEQADPDTSGPQEEVYSCEMCPVSYSNPKDLRKHVSDHIINGGTMTTSTPSSLKQALQAPAKPPTNHSQVSALQQQLQAPLKPLGPISDDLAAINNHQSNQNTDDSEDSSDSQSSSSSSSSTSSSKQAAPGAYDDQSQEHKCRVCGTVCADQLEMMTCLISHTANAD